MILDFIFGARASDEKSKILTSAELEKYLSTRNRSASGVNVTLDRAMKFATYFACVRVLAESAGLLPCHLYRQEGRNKEKALEHPLYSLLHNAPNDQMTAQEYREWTVACLAISGNAYSQINRVRGRIYELLPFTGGEVQPKVDAGTRKVSYVVTTAPGRQEELPASEVFHVKLFTIDGVHGLSPLGYARETLGMGIASERHGAGFFANGASPSGFLEKATGILSDKAAARLKESFEEQYVGSEKAGKVVLLEEGLKFTAATMSSRDAEWLASRKFTRSELCGLMRVPPHKIADLDRATFSNIEHSEMAFVNDGILPYATRFEQRVWLQLLTPAERKTYFAKFNVAALLRGDMRARAEFYSRQLQAGALSPNEIREYEDQNPREGGDVYLTPSNMLIDGKPPAAPQPGPAPADDPDDDPEPVDE